MVRILVAALLTAMLTACGYGSDVDLAPMAERIPKRILVTGDYCEASTQPPYTITSSDDCIRLEWNQATRSYATFDVTEPDEVIYGAVASLGPNLYLTQIENPDNEARGRYQIFLTLAKGSAFMALPPLRERMMEVAERYPGVTLRHDAADPVIVGGERRDIRNFLRALAGDALRGADFDAGDLAIGVRDRAGAPDHPANPAQARDIADLLRAAQRLP